MSETRIVYAVTLQTFSNPHSFPEIEARIENSGYLALWDHYALKPRAQKWVHEEASMWTDRTGEEFEMPERWMFLVEGWSE